MNIYSLHRVIDGKWEVVLKIREGSDFKHSFQSRPDIKPIIDQHYDATPEELAKALLAEVLHCKSVKVSQLCGAAVIMEKEGI
jgi:hypothetical protein